MKMKVFINGTVGMVVTAEDKKTANGLLKAKLSKTDGFDVVTFKDIAKATKEVKTDKSRVTPLA
jgi:hypothetical protein